MDILTSFIIIPVLTIIGILFCKEAKQVKCSEFGDTLIAHM